MNLSLCRVRGELKAQSCKTEKQYSKESRGSGKYSFSKGKQFFLKIGSEKKKWLKFQEIFKKRKVEDTHIVEYYVLLSKVSDYVRDMMRTKEQE